VVRWLGAGRSREAQLKVPILQTPNSKFQIPNSKFQTSALNLRERNRGETGLVGKLDRGVKFFEPSPERGGEFERWGDELWIVPLLPGYSPDKNTAVIRFTFGPSVHGAMGTYLFKRAARGWAIVWRDFFVLRLAANSALPMVSMDVSSAAPPGGEGAEAF
jgi:hypothetical protein